MKNIPIYILVSISSLTILGYSVHMFIGGFVSPETETWAIAVAIGVGVIILALLALDIVRQHRR